MKRLLIIVVFTSVLAAASVPAATNNWKANTTGDWANSSNWQEGNVPANGDDVVITNTGARVTLSSVSSNLNSLILSRTLVFTNWDTYLSSLEVTILSNGLMTCPGPYTNSVMSNRVWVVCSNLFLANGASINVNTQGYAAIITTDAGQGPGGASDPLAGAGHGGWGGYSRTGLPYGSTNAPESPGSSGSRQSASARGTHGGGAVRIDATGGTVTINGAITANAGNDQQGVGGQYGGGGSGGSVFITCRVLAGTNGAVSALGGNNPGTGGGGGGGRIAVNYDTNAQAVAEIPSVAFSVRAGSSVSSYPGDIGTLWFPDNRLLTTNLLHSGHIIIDGWSNWIVTSLTLTNAWARFPADGMRITVSNDLVVSGANARLELGGNILTDTNLYRGGGGFWLIYSKMTSTPALHVGGNALLANGGSLYMYAALTNAVTPEYGALFSVTGNVTIGTGCVFYVTSNPTNDGNVFMVMSNLLVMTNGSINAYERGYACQVSPLRNFGPGAPTSVAGAGHGGRGGYGFYGGPECDSLTDPRQAGSCGGNYNSTWLGSSGGGVIRIRANDTVTVNGTLTVDSRAISWAGSGAGGAINITSRVFRASGGVLRSKGGDKSQNGGSGSGGRIAIHYDPIAQASEPVPDMTIVLSPGSAPNEQGQLGTLYLTDGLWITNASGGNFTKLNAAMPQFSALNYTNLLVSNCWVSFPADGVQMTVSGNARIEASGRLYLGGGNSVSNNVPDRREHSMLPYQVFYSGAPPALQCGGDMTLTNGGSLYIYAGPTNGGLAEVGGEVNVSGALVLGTNSWIYPISHYSNGGSARLKADSLYIATNAGIYAASSGYLGGGTNAGGTSGWGPGGGANRGGGYGGQGGYAAGGPTYGLSNAPAQAGSGGGAWGVGQFGGGAGGGLVWVQTPGAITLSGGTLNANGESGSTWGNSGSGGGILLDCGELIGNGTLTANGGAGLNRGGGGGGRISIWWGGITDEDRNKLYAGQHNSITRLQPNTAPPNFTGTYNVSGGAGAGAAASNGTVTLLYIPPAAGTMFIIQ